jgi:transposase
MSFQAYLDNILAKTGKTPEQFKNLAAKAGVYNPEMKAGDLVGWLKKEFDLGHGHSMAVWAVFKSKGWVSGKARASTAKRPGAKAT